MLFGTLIPIIWSVTLYKIEKAVHSNLVHEGNAAPDSIDRAEEQFVIPQP